MNESQNIEYKQSWHDEYLKWVCGFPLEELKGEHNSRPRNPKIAKACFMAGYIDAWGRGVFKILNACKEANLPEPGINEMNGGIEVTLFKATANQNRLVDGLVKGLVKNLVKGLVKELSDTQIKILNLISEDMHITKSDMAKHIGTSSTTVDNHIEILKTKKVLERIGGRKTGYWHIIEQK